MGKFAAAASKCRLHLIVDHLEQRTLPAMDNWDSPMVCLNVAMFSVQVPEKSRCLTIYKEGQIPARVVKVHKNWIENAYKADPDLVVDPYLLGNVYVGRDHYLHINPQCPQCKKKFKYVCNAERCMYVHGLSEKRRRPFRPQDVGAMWESLDGMQRMEVCSVAMDKSIADLLQHFADTEEDEEATGHDIHAFRLASKNGLSWNGTQLGIIIESVLEGVNEMESLFHTKYTQPQSMHNYAGVIIARLTERIIAAYDRAQHDKAMALFEECTLEKRKIVA